MAPKASGPSSWFDEGSNKPLIDGMAKRTASFLEAVADGRIDDHELAAQEQRVVALMREIEPQLDGALHDKVTQLLCELTSYDLMQFMSTVAQARPHSVFQG